MWGSNKPCLECPVLPTSDPGLSGKRWECAIPTTADEQDPAQQGRAPGKQDSTSLRFSSILLTLLASPSLLRVLYCNSPLSASLCLFPPCYINLVKIYFSQSGNFSQNTPCHHRPSSHSPCITQGTACARSGLCLIPPDVCLQMDVMMSQYSHSGIPTKQ